MAHRTVFAGLAAPDIGDSPSQVLNGDFIYRNPDLTAQFLRIGAISHRHDAHLALANPTAAPAVASATGGQLTPSSQYYVTYTLLDAVGGETLAAPSVTVATGSSIPAPSIAPSAIVDNTAGIMQAGNFAYALTYTDGQGGETTLGPVTWVYVDPGFASAQVILSGLATELGSGAVTCRLWRSYEGADWHLVTESSTPTFTDGGFDPPDNPARPPDVSSMAGIGGTAIHVTLPTVLQEPAMASATAINVYLGFDTTFASPALVQTFPISSAGSGLIITSEAVTPGSPPAVATSIPGAAKINPDTDMVNFPWKRPVAVPGALPMTGNASGDTRVCLSPVAIFTWDGVTWEVVAAASGVSGAGGGGASALVIWDAITGASATATNLFMEAIGPVTQQLTDAGGGTVEYTTRVQPWVASAAGGSAKIGNGGIGDGQYDMWGDWAGELAFAGSGAASIAITRVGGTPVVDPDGITRQIGGSAVVTVTVPTVAGASGAVGATGPPGPPGSGGGGAANVGVDGPGGTPLITPITDIRFIASGGASAGVTALGGGSAQISISTTPTPCFLAQDAFGGSAMGGGALARPIEFIASGAASATVTSTGGSAVVLITVAPPLPGPTGPTGATGPSGGGAGGSIQVAGSAGVNAVNPASDIEFAASGALSLSVQDLGGGSARVLISPAPAGAGWSDTFSSNTISNYAFDSGGGTLSVAGGVLVPSDITSKFFYASGTVFGDVVMTAKLTPGASTAANGADFSLMWRRANSTNQLFFQAYAPNGTTDIALFIKKDLANTITTVNTMTATGLKYQNGRSYWLRLVARGAYMRGEIWTQDPLTAPAGAVPFQSVEGVLGATDFASVPPAAVGIRWIPDSTSATVDDFRVTVPSPQP